MSTFLKQIYIEVLVTKLEGTYFVSTTTNSKYFEIHKSMHDVVLPVFVLPTYLPNN